MSNSIKYSVSAQSLALRKGDFFIGTGDVGKGPSSTTGYFKATAPPPGGYRIYLYNDALSGDIAYHTAANDSELISFTNRVSGESFTTANECLTYYATQTDKICFNREYEPIVTDGLVLNLDAGFTPSYPRSGTTWYDICSSGKNGTLVNGPTFNSVDGGSIVFDGVDDVCNFPVNTFNSGEPQNGTYYFRIKYPPYTSVQTILFNEGAAFNNGVIYYKNPATPTNRYFFVNFANITSGTSNVVAVIDGLTPGSWFDVAFTFDSFGGWAAYKDGVVSTSGQQANFISWVRQGNSTPILRASSQLGSGNCQLFYYYNRALTASEVLQNYNATKSRFGL